MSRGLIKDIGSLKDAASEIQANLVEARDNLHYLKNNFNDGEMTEEEIKEELEDTLKEVQSAIDKIFGKY